MMMIIIMMNMSVKADVDTNDVSQDVHGEDNNNNGEWWLLIVSMVQLNTLKMMDDGCPYDCFIMASSGPPPPVFFGGE